MKYECRRCGYSSSKLKDLKKHLDQDIKCQPILEDISTLVLQKELYSSSNLPLHVQISKEIDQQIEVENEKKKLKEAEEKNEYKIYENESHYKIYSKDGDDTISDNPVYVLNLLRPDKTSLEDICKYNQQEFWTWLVTNGIPLPHYKKYTTLIEDSELSI